VRAHVVRGGSDRASRVAEGRGGFVCLGGSSSASWANLEKNSARGAWDGDDLPVSGAWPGRYRVFLLASSVHRVSSRAARRVLTGEKKISSLGPSVGCDLPWLGVRFTTIVSCKVHVSVLVASSRDGLSAVFALLCPSSVRSAFFCSS
jgi:hypothetical protein